MKERNGPNAIFKGGKVSAPQSASLDVPQSAKRTNAISVKERNEQTNAICQGGEPSASLSPSLADPESAKKNECDLDETKKWPAKCNKFPVGEAECIT